jgi:hypothetical protein
MFVVPNFPHLRGIEMRLQYRELLLPLSKPASPAVIPSKWQTDPDVDPNQTFGPLPKYYVNGEFVRQDQQRFTRLSDRPFPEDKVPRKGLIQIHPNDPDYEDVSKKQCLDGFRPGNQASPSSSTNPQPGDADHQPDQMNGITPPSSDVSKSINGGSPVQGTAPDLRPSQYLPNGISEHVASPESAPPSTVS